MHIKTVKFGGSSLADAEQFLKVANIIKCDDLRRVVIPSAPGKRFENDKKVTDMLYSCYEMALNGEDFSELFEEISARFLNIAEKLKLSVTERLKDELADIRRNISELVGKDYAASRGEYLCGILLADYLNFSFIDAADMIKFDCNNRLMEEETSMLIQEAVSSKGYAVIPGFYGASPDGKIVTFPRGGSDITGAIVAAALKADVYENWTDVSGLLACDPRIVNNPRPIHYISYKALKRLSSMGATVLHEDAIMPVYKAEVPIHICNTNAPTEIGTFVTKYDVTRTDRGMVIGISGMNNFISVIMINADGDPEFAKKIFSVFKVNDLPYDYVSFDKNEMQIALHKEEFDLHKESLLKDMRRVCTEENITFDNDLALISIIGNESNYTDKMLPTLSKKRIQIKSIFHDTDGIETVIGVKNEALSDSLKYLYSVFFTNQKNTLKQEELL